MHPPTQHRHSNLLLLSLCTVPLILPVFLAASTTACLGQVSTKSPAIPAGWTLSPTPAENSEAMHCANFSQQQQVWLSDAGTLQIAQLPRRAKPIPPPELPPGAMLQPGMAGYESTLKVQDGWLLGFDAGEFGGGLWFEGTDGSVSRLLEENVHGFVETARGVMIFAGLAHMMTDRGEVLIARYPIRVDTKLESLAPLDGAPEAFTKTSPDEALVVTTHGVSRISSSGAHQALTRSMFSLLYPNSIVSTPEGTIYVGMRLFVVRLLPAPKPGEYTEQWLVPKGCEKFHKEGFTCACSNQSEAD